MGSEVNEGAFGGLAVSIDNSVSLVLNNVDCAGMSTNVNLP